MILKIKKLNVNAIVPQRATIGSAGYDLCACISSDVKIAQNEIVKIPTGIAAEISPGNAALLIFPRSGLATTFGITLANSVGLIDSDYRGEIFVPLINLGDEEFTVKPNMRIAQLVVSPILTPEVQVFPCLSDTFRGNGGFGSTGLS